MNSTLKNREQKSSCKDLAERVIDDGKMTKDYNEPHLWVGQLKLVSCFGWPR